MMTTTAPFLPGTTALRVSANAPTGAEAWSVATLGRRFGRRRGLVDGVLPPLVLVLVSTLASARTARPSALWPGQAPRSRSDSPSAAPAGVAAAGARRLLAGLTVAVGFAVATGEARAYFLPGILVDAAYAVAFLISALVGRPFVATVHALLFPRASDARAQPAVRRALANATVGWSGVFALRAAVQAVLYQGDEPALLAVSKILLGWPLTALALVLTLSHLRRAAAGPQRPATPSPS